MALGIRRSGARESMFIKEECLYPPSSWLAISRGLLSFGSSLSLSRPFSLVCAKFIVLSALSVLV